MNWHPSSSSEQNAISQLLLDEWKAVEHYNEEIFRLEEIIGKLHRQRAEHQKLIDGLNSLDAPIKRLPVEVLTKIFYQHIYEAWNTTPHLLGMAPLVLGLVCRHWRHIALSNKRMWSYVGLDADVFGEGLDHYEGGAAQWDRREKARVFRASRIVEKYLERSEPLPLSIKVRSSRDTHVHEPVFRLLVSHSKRWHDVELDLEGGLLQRGRVLGGIEGNLPVLEKLLLNLQRPSADTIRSFSKCPRLRAFATVGAQFNFPSLPSHQLTKLLVEDPRAKRLLKLIRACPQLTHLWIDSSKYDAAVAQHQAEDRTTFIVQSQVRAISITLPQGHSNDSNLSEFAHLCSRLILPCLESFSIGSCLPEQGLYRWPKDAFISLLLRAPCLLGTLIFENIIIADMDLIQILELVPTLTTLTIREPPELEGVAHPIVTNHFFRSLIHIDGITTIAPRLSHLDLTVVPYFDNAALFHMIESRWSPMSVNSPPSTSIAPLEFLRIKMTDGLTRMRELRVKGLRVNLR